jgi:hypothetical protein
MPRPFPLSTLERSNTTRDAGAAQKPRRPTKENGSIQDGTILGIRRLGNLAVPFRLSPRWQECPIA